MKFNHSVWNNVLAEVKKEITKQTFAVEDEAKHLILDTPKTGRLYPRGNGRVHQASAPGEPFANDTGNALSQIRVRFEDNNLTGIVSAGAEYAAALEFGTETMEPRPVFRPALHNKEKDIRQGIQDAVQRGINKSV